jgi:hypothetical protein
MVWRILFVTALLTLAGGLGLFLWEMRPRRVRSTVARTVAVNALVIGEIAYLFNCRRLTGSALNLKAPAPATPTSGGLPASC